MDNKHLIEQVTQKTSKTTNDDSSDVAQISDGLPIESLISKPIIAVAKGQQELTSVYNDTLMHLLLTDKIDEGTKEKHAEIPNLYIDCPLPAFTMDELKIDFNMEAKTPVDTPSHTEGSAKYNIRVHAAQQPPSEGMAKLADLLSQIKEPIPTKDEPK